MIVIDFTNKEFSIRGFFSKCEQIFNFLGSCVVSAYLPAFTKENIDLFTFTKKMFYLLYML